GKLEYLFPKRRARKLHRKVGGAVVLVDYRVHFDDFEAEHAAVVGDDLHGEVGFAVGCAPAHGGCDSGSIFGVDPVHVEGNVVTGGAASGCPQRLFHDGAHSALVDVAHGVDLCHAGPLDVGAFGGIDVPNADKDGVLRGDLGRVAQHVRELLRPHAQQGRPRHSVDVADPGSVGCIDVGVGVDPDVADFLVLAAIKPRHSRN